MTKTSLFANSLACLLVLSPCCGNGAEPAEKPISQAGAALAIYVKNDGLASDPGPEPFTKVILAIWGDGKIVWSHDRLRGGAPYHTAEIDPPKIQSLLANLKRDGLFTENSFQRAYFGPDSRYTTILVRFGKDKLEMSSWHELAESSGNSVSADGSITGLDGRQLYQVLKDGKPEYLLFRMTWNEIRARAAELVPSEGKPANGKFKMDLGDFSWRSESAAK
jgi:hypothetical protein